MNIKELQTKQKEIVNWFNKEYINEEGIPIFAIDYRSKKIVETHNSLAELGDYAPFLFLSGAESFVNGQYEISKKYLISDKYFFESYRGWKNLFIPQRANVFYYSDFILGLLELYNLNKNIDFLNLAKSNIDKVLDKFYLKGFLCKWYLPLLNYRFPVSESNGGVFIEILLDFYRVTNNKMYLEKAQEILNSWIHLDFFKKNRIFPVLHTLNRHFTVIRRIRQESHQSRLVKHNVVLISSLLEFYYITNNSSYLEIIDTWLEGIKDNFLNEEGGAYSLVEFAENDSNIKKRYNPHIKNHALVDILCDLYWVTNNEKYIDVAKRITQYWLKRQSNKTGLFPFYDNGDISYFDGETDWIIALMKMYELTKQSLYKERAERIFEGQLKHHYTELGYVNGVNIYTGDIVDSLIETRYVTLFLKAILFFLWEKPIYSPDRKMFYLMRDR